MMNAHERDVCFTSINQAMYNLPRMVALPFCGVWIDWPNQTWTDRLWKVRYSAVASSLDNMDSTEDKISMPCLELILQPKFSRSDQVECYLLIGGAQLCPPWQICHPPITWQMGQGAQAYYRTVVRSAASDWDPRTYNHIRCAHM